MIKSITLSIPLTITAAFISEKDGNLWFYLIPIGIFVVFLFFDLKYCFYKVKSKKHENGTKRLKERCQHSSSVKNTVPNSQINNF